MMFVTLVRDVAFAMCILALLAGGAYLYTHREDPVRKRTLLYDDLPANARPIAHVHAAGETHVDEEGNPKAEMLHYGTREALQAGGPIYGVYSDRIVAIEYEIPVDTIVERPVGEDDPGEALAAELLEVTKSVPYDHFHIGKSTSDFGGGPVRDIYRIHFMLIPHEEELRIGLSCS